VEPILSFSGWGQEAGTLLPVVPEAFAFDYMHYSSMEVALSLLAAASCRVAVGWSLGGQVLLRAVAAGIIRPEKVVLIATPLVFSHPEAESFYAQVEQNRDTALARFRLMIAAGDSNKKAVIEGLPDVNTSVHLLYWLQQLYDFNGEECDFSAFPPALILHGKRDMVVPFSQAEHLERRLPCARLVAFEEAGHAPHLHQREEVRRLIANYVV
jgi:pimeloyl-ACP methyl ester carboxylesterase